MQRKLWAPSCLTSTAAMPTASLAAVQSRPV